MIQNLKTLLMSALLIISLLVVAAPVAAIAQTTGSVATNKASACDALTQIGGNCNDGESGVTTILRIALNILSFVVGLIAVIMIIIAGLRYITSNGDANTITSAKNTIIYAIVGLMVVAFAQIIVSFVLNKATGSVQVQVPSPAGASSRTTP